MSSLAKASVLFVADTHQLDSKLAKSEKDIEGWGSRVGKKLKSIGGGFAGIGKSIIKGGAAGVGFALGKLGLDSIGGIGDKLSELKDIGEYAQGIGVTGEQMARLSGLARYANTDVKQVLEGLATFNGMIADAGKGGEADKLFAGLGVAADQFKGMNAHDQFFKLFDALNKSDDPMGRFQLLMRASGEDVGKLMIKLARFSGTELDQLATKYGYTNKEIAEATVASESFADAQLKIENASVKLAIALAPVVDTLATTFTDAINGNGNAVSNWGNSVIPVFQSVGMAIARVVDVMRNIPDMLNFSAMGWTGLLGKGIEGVGGLTGNQEMKDFGKILFDEAEAGGVESLKRMMNFWEISDKTAALFEFKAIERLDKVSKVEQRLAKSSPVKGLGTSGGIKEMKPLEGSLFGSNQWQTSFARQDNHLRNQLTQQQKAQQLMQIGNQILQSIDRGVQRFTGFGLGSV